MSNVGHTEILHAEKLLASVAESLSKNPEHWKHSIAYVTNYRELELIVATDVPYIMRGLAVRLLASTSLAPPSIYLLGGNTLARTLSMLRKLQVLRALDSTVPSST